MLAELRRLAARHPRYGYRRIWALLRRAGQGVNLKRVYRLWCLAGLTLPRRRPRPKQRTGARVHPLATELNAVWTYDFVHDWAARGGQFKCLSGVDEYAKECLALEAARSLPAREVLRVLGQLVVRCGPPRYLRSDTGPESIARRVRRWLAGSGIQTAYIDPGRPWQHGVGESFHSRLRDECLDREWFHSWPKRGCCSSNTAASTTRRAPTRASGIAPRLRSGNTVPGPRSSHPRSTVR